MPTALDSDRGCAVSSTPSGRTVYPLAITAAFFALALAGILRHEMWRDEIEIWLIATESSSIGELLHNARTQPHPLLWYLLTYLLSRLTPEPLAMQLLSLAVGTATVWLFARHAPFPILHRVLLCFGYFPLFEYTIISRSYGLDLLLSVLFCVLYTKRPRNLPALALVLALLANVHLLGAVIAAIFLLLLLWDAANGRLRDRGARWLVPSSLAAGAAGILLGCGRVLLGASRMGSDHVQRAPFDLEWLTSTFSSIYYAFLPFPDVFERTFWNTNILALASDGLHRWIAVALSVALLAACFAALRRSVALCALFGAGTLAMLVIFAEKSSAYLRHYGHLAILFVALLWIARADATGSPASAPSRRTAAAGHALFTIVLALHVAAGAFAYGVDLAYPFSNSHATARYIADHPTLADAVLVGSIDYTTQPIAAYLGRSIFYPDQRTFATFMDWGPRRQIVRYKQVLHDAGTLARDQGKPVLMVLDYDPLVGGVGGKCRFEADLEVELLAAFRCAVVPDENYWLASVRVIDGSAAAGGTAAQPGLEVVPRRARRRQVDGRPCISARNHPVGPHVEIPRLQATESARRERRRLARLAASASVAPGDHDEEAVTDEVASGSRDQSEARDRRRERRERLAAAHRAQVRQAARGLTLAACDADSL